MAKRVLDIALSTVLLVPACVLMLIVAVITLVREGRPILFSQGRAGYHGTPFQLYKFRSMSNSVGADGAPLSDDARVTAWGRFLRASSLDELPQLWNVLRGDMSIVGPRPLPVFYLSRYSPRQSRRHLVRPGITGWAQIHGRNALNWEQKLDFDIWYVEHQTLGLDLKILWMTARKVFLRDGISPAGQLTSPEFLGGGDPEDRGDSGR